MVFALEGLVWANGTWVSWRLECLVVLSSEVTPIVFSAGKGLCAKLTLYSDLGLFFSQMASQRVRSAKVLLTLLTSRHGRGK